MSYDPLEDDDDNDAELMELAQAAAEVDFDEHLMQFDQAAFDAMRDGLLDDDTDIELSAEQIAAKQAEIEAKRFDPVPYNLKQSKKRIAVVDSETDPFEHGLSRQALYHWGLL
jgi:hypothetical protein